MVSKYVFSNTNIGSRVVPYFDLATSDRHDVSWVRTFEQLSLMMFLMCLICMHFLLAPAAS